MNTIYLKYMQVIGIREFHVQIESIIGLNIFFFFFKNLLAIPSVIDSFKKYFWAIAMC